VNKSFQKLYPFKSCHFRLPSNLSMHYVDEGPRDGEVILCLHGNPTWSFFYRNIIESFRQKYRVIAPDHLGCGLSDRFQSKTYRLEDHIQNLDRLISALGLKSVTLVMHDWGGGNWNGLGNETPRARQEAGIYEHCCFFV